MFLAHACFQVYELPSALDSTPEVKTVFDFPVSLEYIVTLSECGLGTKIHVENHSDEDPFEFQALFHNYIRAPANDATISSLTGKKYFDKTNATADAKATPRVERRKAVGVQKFTDSVYVDGGEAYEITWPQGKIKIETEGLKDLVIWNPQETVGKAIGDMEDGGWCVLSAGLQDGLFILIQGEIRMRRTRPCSGLHHSSRQKNLDWRAVIKDRVVTKKPYVRTTG